MANTRRLERVISRVVEGGPVTIPVPVGQKWTLRTLVLRHGGPVALTVTVDNPGALEQQNIWSGAVPAGAATLRIPLNDVVYGGEDVRFTGGSVVAPLDFTVHAIVLIPG